MRIRTRLLVFGLSILLPAFLSCAVAIWFVYSEQQQAQEKSLKEAVKSFAMLIDKNFLAAEGQLLALSKAPDLARGDLDSFLTYAKSLVPTPERVIVLSTLEGQQLLNTRAQPGAKLPQNHATLLRKREENPGKPLVSDLFVSSVAKRKDIAVDIPVSVDGAPKYRMSLGFQAAELQNLIVEQDFPAEWIVTILDTKGVVVARSVNPDQFVGLSASQTMLQRILARERSGINLGQSLDGHPVAAYFFRAPDSGWTAVLSVPQTETRRPALFAAAGLALILVLALCVAVVAAGYFARRTAVPIERLRSAAQLLGLGQAVVLEPAGLAEIDAVGDALLKASTLVRQHQEVLEERVAEAVAASEVAQRALLQAQKLEALGRLTGGIAHDFNNILQTLSSCFQLLRLTQDRDRIDALLGTGEKAIRRATDVTTQMRSFARVQDVRLETVDLGDAIQAVTPLLSSSLPGNIVLRAEIADGLWPVTIDRLQFELALLNVTINARDAMPRGGDILLSVHNATIAQGQASCGPGDFVVLSVADKGTGMPPEVLAKALDPFFTTKPVDKGSGLGLPQAYGFATQADGALVIQSVEGQGTTIIMYLPRSNAAPAAAAAPAPRPALRSSAREVILFAEDDLLVRETVGAALEHAGFEVLTAGSGNEALAVLESGLQVDILFSDVIMPGSINGVELARIARRQFPALRIVLASGHADIAIDLDRVRLIGKPYDVISLINMLGDPISA